MIINKIAVDTKYKNTILSAAAVIQNDIVEKEAGSVMRTSEAENAERREKEKRRENILMGSTVWINKSLTVRSIS